MKRKVVTYIRVSTEEQAKHGYSIPAQRQVLQDYAKGHDLEIVQEFEESQSAHKPGRPQFNAMLKFLKKYGEVTAVLCYKIDRIARNLTDYSALSEMEGIQIISATEALPENATGQLMATIQAGISKYYSDQLSERVRLGLETKAKKGIWPAGAPTGYRNLPEGKGIVPDVDMAPIVREVFERYARGDIPLSELVRWAADRGLRTRKGGILAKGPIHKLLTNPIYYGTIRWHDVLHKGEHEPLISKALFEHVQERLKSKSVPRGKRIFPYRGLLQCGYCGCQITASVAKKKYIYYHCTHGRGKCPQVYVAQEQMGEMLLPVVENVHLSENLVGMLLQKMRAEKQHREEARKKRLQELRHELTQVSHRRNLAYNDKLDGKIDEERWLELERTWSRRADTIRGEMEFLAASQGTLEDDLQATFELLKRAPVLYKRQSDEEKARLLRVLLSNCQMRGENVEPIYKTPFDLVELGVRSGDWLGREDSNLRSRLQRPLPYHLATP